MERINSIVVLEELSRLSNSETINASVSDNYNKKEVCSVSGNVQVGFDNGLCPDVTARNDWSYFSPSVNGVLSEVWELPDFLPFLKTRGFWAQVGNDTEPYNCIVPYGCGRYYPMPEQASTDAESNDRVLQELIYSSFTSTPTRDMLANISPSN